MLALMLLLSSWTLADRIEAIVGDEPILRSDVVMRVAESYPGADGPEYMPGGAVFEAALAEIVEERLVVEGARMAGYYPPAEEISSMVQARITEMMAGFRGEEEFLAALSASGLTREELEARLSALLADQRAASDYARSVASSSLSALPADPVGYLNANLDLLESELLPRRLSWILIPVLPSGPDADSALLLLDSIRTAVTNGLSFEEAAALHSQDPGSAAAGGSLGTFGPGDMTPTFESALRELEAGEISPPFLSPYGAHIARLDSRDSTGAMNARHILVLVALDEEDLDLATARADSLAARLRSGRIGFETAAALESCDPLTSSDGGDLGVVLVKLELPEATQAILPLGPGEVSQPVPMGDGTALALFRVSDEAGAVDWSGFDSGWLSELVRNVAYHHSIETLVDSLRLAIPVVYPADAD